MRGAHESVKRAKREQKKSSSLVVVPAREKRILQSSSMNMQSKIVDLYYSINSLLANSNVRIIQFLGSREGEGTSTIVRELAMIAVSRFHKSVLLVDADMKNSRHHAYFKVNPVHSLEEAVKEDKSLHYAIRQISNSDLYIGSLCHESFSSPKVFDLLKHSTFQDDDKVFDFILIDSPPASISSIGLAIAPLVDGVVIILEAEKTRWPMVESIKNKIIKSGGNILGIVFNKRKFYIPNFIYKMF